MPSPRPDLIIRDALLIDGSGAPGALRRQQLGEMGGS
jgi:hypothetical protein